jgi:hypothetical protein
MEGILVFLLNSEILNEKAVQAARRELDDGADPYFVTVAYSALPPSMQAWCRLATDDARANDLSGLSKSFLRFAGFLDATNRMPEDVKRYMQPIMELWRD